MPFLNRENINLLIDMSLNDEPLENREIFRGYFLDHIFQKELADKYNKSLPTISRICERCNNKLLEDNCLKNFLHGKIKKRNGVDIRVSKKVDIKNGVEIGNNVTDRVNITSTNLVGDAMLGTDSYPKQLKFLVELEMLMIKHEVSEIDVWWKNPKINKGEK